MSMETNLQSFRLDRTYKLLLDKIRFYPEEELAIMCNDCPQHIKHRNTVGYDRSLCSKIICIEQMKKFFKEKGISVEDLE